MWNLIKEAGRMMVVDILSLFMLMMNWLQNKSTRVLDSHFNHMLKYTSIHRRAHWSWFFFLFFSVFSSFYLPFLFWVCHRPDPSDLLLQLAGPASSDRIGYGLDLVCTGLFWCGPVCSGFVLVSSGLCWFVLVCHGLYLFWFGLFFTSLYWFV